ncbi:MAG: hypothetical protein ACR2GY_00105 [Phycisphaerales bacterium]
MKLATPCLALILAAATLTFAACKGETPADDGTGSTGTTTTPTGSNAGTTGTTGTDSTNTNNSPGGFGASAIRNAQQGSNSAEGTNTNNTSNDANAQEMTPKQVIEHHLELLRNADTDALRAAVTERQRDRVSEATVLEGSQAAKAITSVDEIFESVEFGTDEAGNKTAKIMMPGGRSLTTLIMLDGKWYADTIWWR